MMTGIGLGACGDRGEQPEQSIHVPYDAGPVWRVSPEPVMRIGEETTADWGELVGLAVLPDGRVAVAGDYPPAISLFSATGTFLRSVGRRGSGPGEFNEVGTFQRYEDTLFVADLRDVGQHFTLDGRYVRTSPRPVAGGRLHGVLANGDRIVGRLQLEQVTPGGWVQAPEVLERVSDSARVALGSFASQRFTRSADGQLMSEVFTPNNRVVVFPDGFCAGYAGGTEITCHDADGTRTGVISLRDRQPVLVSAADQEAYFNDVYLSSPGVPKAQLDAEIASMRERISFAKELGVFGRLLASRDSLLWVGPPSTDVWRTANRNAVPDSASEWSVYTRAGTKVAQLVLPARFLPLDVGAEYVAGVTSGEDDALVVVIYQLLRR